MLILINIMPKFSTAHYQEIYRKNFLTSAMHEAEVLDAIEARHTKKPSSLQQVFLAQFNADGNLKYPYVAGFIESSDIQRFKRFFGGGDLSSDSVDDPRDKQLSDWERFLLDAINFRIQKEVESEILRSFFDNTSKLPTEFPDFIKFWQTHRKDMLTKQGECNFDLFAIVAGDYAKHITQSNLANITLANKTQPIFILEEEKFLFNPEMFSAWMPSQSIFKKPRTYIEGSMPLLFASMGAAIGGIVGIFLGPLGAAIGAGFGAAAGITAVGLSRLFIGKGEVAHFFGTVLTTLGSSATGAGIGALLGTLVFPGLGSGIGALIGAGIGCAAGIVISGFAQIIKSSSFPARIAGASLMAVGTTASGALIGAILGSIIPGWGTLAGLGIGAAVGFATTAAPTLIGSIITGLNHAVSRLKQGFGSQVLEEEGRNPIQHIANLLPEIKSHVENNAANTSAVDVSGTYQPLFPQPPQQAVVEKENEEEKKQDTLANSL